MVGNNKKYNKKHSTSWQASSVHGSSFQKPTNLLLLCLALSRLWAEQFKQVIGCQLPGSCHRNAAVPAPQPFLLCSAPIPAADNTPLRGGGCQPGREMGTSPRGMIRHTGTVAPSPLKICLPTAQRGHHYLQKKSHKSSFQSWLVHIVSNKQFGFPMSLYCCGVMSLA